MYVRICYINIYISLNPFHNLGTFNRRLSCLVPYWVVGRFGKGKDDVQLFITTKKKDVPSLTCKTTYQVSRQQKKNSTDILFVQRLWSEHAYIKTPHGPRRFVCAVHRRSNQTKRRQAADARLSKQKRKETSMGWLLRLQKEDCCAADFHNGDA